MDQRCEKCGLENDGRQKLHEAGTLFKSQRLCPNCHLKRQRLEFLVIAATGIVAGPAIWLTTTHPQAGFSGLTLAGASFFAISTIRVAVHEFAHALVARRLGVRVHRIVLGAGPLMGWFRFAGFPWHIHAWLFNRCRVEGDFSESPSRVTSFLVSAAGPVAEMVWLASLPVMRWAVIGRGSFENWEFGWAGAVSYTGLIYLKSFLSSLKPMSMTAAKLDTERMLAAALACRDKGMLAASGRASPATAQSAGAWRFQSAVMLAGAFLIIAGWVAMLWVVWLISDGICILALSPMLLTGWGRSIKHGGSPRMTLFGPVPAALEESPAWRHLEGSVMHADHEQAMAQLQPLLAKHPDEFVLLRLQIMLLEKMGREQEADFAYAELLEMRRSEPAVRIPLVTDLLLRWTRNGRHEEVARTVKELLQEPLPVADKVGVLDSLACLPLYEGITSLLPLAQRFIRQALELHPGNLTLQGTLGGLLYDSGRREEALPILMHVDAMSESATDKGICSMFLALAVKEQGDTSKARRLARRARTLYPMPWLLKRLQQAGLPC